MRRAQDGLKTCPGPCGQTLPLEAFRPSASRTDGLRPYCPPCDTLLHRRRSKLRTMGRTETGLVDATPARGHVEQLLVQGMTRHQVALLAGVDRTQVRNLVVGQPPRQGPAKRLRPATAAALLAVRFTPCEPTPVEDGRSRRAGATLDPTGTRRRLEALMANGWPAADLARRLGHTSGLQLPRYRRVTSSTAAAVRALYDELADTPGPSPRAVTLYRGRGYLHPGWWDPDIIDDPDADPAGLVDVVHTPARTPLEWDRSRPRAEQVQVLTRTGLTPAQVADALNVPIRYVHLELRKAAA